MMKNTTSSVASMNEAITTTASAGDDERRQMFDLTLIQEEQQWTAMNNNKNSSSSHQRQEDADAARSSSSLSCLPPMETLSLYTTDDDNTSVSSVSTQGSVTRRSVFSQYWKKTGQEPPTYLSRAQLTSPPSPPPPPRETAADLDDVQQLPAAMLLQHSSSFLSTAPEHEEVLDIQVPSLPQIPAAFVSPARRSVLPRNAVMKIRHSSSAPSLAAVAAAASFDSGDSTPLSSRNKTRSLSHLLTKQPSASCLRESRYSPSNASAAGGSSNNALRRDSSSDASSVASSVRFDLEAVAVRHFELPQERYAEEGWSDYFQ